MLADVHSSSELAAFGATKADINEMLASGRLRRICRGWYAAPMADPGAILAVSAGGRLSCLSACAAHGLGVPRLDKPHVMVGAGRDLPAGAIAHRHRGRMPPTAVFDLEASLHDPESALMVIESAVNRGRVAPHAARRALADPLRRGDASCRAPALRPRRDVGHRDPRAAVLPVPGVPVRTQVGISGLGRVDLLVGRSLIVECDSAAHHSDHREGRRRDLVARSLGFQVLRLSYDQVMHGWEATQQVLAAVLATRKHLRAPRSLG